MNNDLVSGRKCEHHPLHFLTHAQISRIISRHISYDGGQMKYFSFVAPTGFCTVVKFHLKNKSPPLFFAECVLFWWIVMHYFQIL